MGRIGNLFQHIFLSIGPISDRKYSIDLVFIIEVNLLQQLLNIHIAVAIVSVRENHNGRNFIRLWILHM